MNSGTGTSSTSKDRPSKPVKEIENNPPQQPQHPQQQGQSHKQLGDDLEGSKNTRRSSENNIDPALYNDSPDAKRVKLTNQVSPPQFTGWTPLISKTISQEQFNFQSTTPSSSKFINNILLNSNSHNSILPVNDIDYSNGFNLTPFLNHNLNLLNSNVYANPSSSNQHNQNFTSLTPFHDKTLHLSDFFIESPIRGTPVKELETITPSKFNLNSIKKSTPLFQEPKSAKKRSIHELDTPNKQPHKLSISTKASDATDEENSDDENDEENRMLGMHNPRKQQTSILDRSRGVLSNLQTPSKIVILGEITNNVGSHHDNNKDAKTPSRTKTANFMTPAKPTQNSSPSTVILSSSSKSPSKERKFVPTSPTPSSKFVVKRDDSLDNVVVKQNPPPIKMGTFSEASLKANANKKSFKTSRNQELSNKVNQSSNTARPRFGNNVQVNNMRFQPNNKAQMQAGMNKFQIQLSDGNGSRRGRKGKKHLQEKKKAASKKEVVVETQAHADSTLNKKSARQTKAKRNTSPGQGQMNVNDNDTQSQVRDQLQPQHHANNTMNNSSINHNSMNTSGLNVSQNTDHTSFDFGVLSSTPNGKYLLDKMFEKPSPQSQQLISQVLMGQQFHGMPPPQGKTQHPGPIQGQGTQAGAGGNSGSIQQNSQVMMMMMSTPNPQQMYSPNPDTEEAENDGANISLSAFTYNFEQRVSGKFNQDMLPLMSQDHE